MRRAFLILAASTLLGLVGVGGAQAQQTDPGHTLVGSSSSATPVAARGYDVSPSGITLPADTTFDSFTYVTYWVTALDGTRPRAFGIDLVPEDGAVGARHIGASFLLFDDARAAYPEGYCVTWVEVSSFEQRFGDGDEAPECTVHPNIAAVNGVTDRIIGAGTGATAAADVDAAGRGFSVSGPAPIAGLVSVLVIAAAAVLMVRFGSLPD